MSLQQADFLTPNTHNALLNLFINPRSVIKRAIFFGSGSDRIFIITCSKTISKKKMTNIISCIKIPEFLAINNKIIQYSRDSLVE
jgi:hypothetical protein